MHIPTVRVANPADPSNFMTINASEYRPLVHGDLWHEQADGFAGIPAPPPTVYSEAERRFAADLLLETVAFRELAVNDREFHTLSPPERMTVLRDMRHEFERSRDEHLERRKRRAQVSDRESAELVRENQVDKDQVVPGKTPGHPVDAATGEALDLTDEQRADLAKQQLDSQAAPQGNVEGQAAAGTTLDQALAKPVQAAEAAKPAWAAAKPAPPPALPPAPTVEKGPGGKYYVMAPGGGKPLSPGFAKKADAEAELPKYTSN